MALYTKHGDDGDTDPGNGRPVRKSDARIAALGEVDELNAQIGLCLSACSAAGSGEVAEVLRPVQTELCTIAAVLSLGPSGRAVTLEDSAAARLEHQIDTFWKELPPLKHLVLPGGCELACRLHVARGVCRRVERTIVALADSGAGEGESRSRSKKVPPEIFRYVNRLGDLLFVLARLANLQAGVNELTWTRPK